MSWWRRLIGPIVYLILIFYTFFYITLDRALLSALFAFLLAANLTVDFVNWADRKVNET